MPNQMVLRCIKCREPLIEHRPDGRIDVSGSKVTIDPNRHEGVVAIVTCRCGAQKTWIVRERERPEYRRAS